MQLCFSDAILYYFIIIIILKTEVFLKVIIETVKLLACM